MTFASSVCGARARETEPVRRPASLLRHDGVLEYSPTRLLTERLGTTSFHRTPGTKGTMMKTIFATIHRAVWSMVLSFLAMSQAAPAPAKDMTAFELVKEGNRYIGEQSKDKVVQIRSEKSVGGLTPNIWYVVYYDPDAILKAVEVKFGAGQKLDVKRPARLLEPITKADEPLAKEKLKVDSDKALDIASKQPVIGPLKLTASRLILERRSLDDSTPVWKVRLWAARVRNPNDNADIGEVILSAEDGAVLKSDLKPEHVD